MSYSIQRAVSDGTLSSLALSIQYYSRADISVYLSNTLWPVGTVWSWSGATGSTIKFKDPVPKGMEVMVKRITDVSGIRHNFSQGAQFTSATLDDNFKQMLFVAQEAQEGGRTITDVFGDIDMHGFKVRNMGAATELSGAAQLAQAGGGLTGNTPGITTQSFVGDGAKIAFPLSASSLSMFVYVQGVYQQRDSWSIVGTELVFSEAPPKGTTVEVLAMGTVGSSAVATSFASNASIPDTNVQDAIVRVDNKTQGLLDLLVGRVFNAADKQWAGGLLPNKSGRDNSAALAAVSAAITANKGGTLYIPPGVYEVGGQDFAGRANAGYAYKALTNVDIRSCTRPVIVDGYGAVFRTPSGLKFGGFDPVTGAAAPPNTNHNYGADIGVMINLALNKSAVVRGVELDGNSSGIVLGGVWGGVGYQRWAYGLRMYNNDGTNTTDVYSHHHGTDGVILGYEGVTAGMASQLNYMVNVRCEYNSRQGLSWVGGIGLTAVNCKFNYTGRGAFSSSPGAGLDIEAEGSVVRNGVFIGCEFAANSGAGFVADSGDSADCMFIGCRFYGTMQYAIWVRKPRFTFINCVIAGSLVNTYTSPNETDRTRFTDCTHTGDLSFDGVPAQYGGYLADVGGQNPIFDGSVFVTNNPAMRLPNSSRATYRNVRMTQNGSTALATPRGTYEGSCSIDMVTGSADMSGAVNAGKLRVTGSIVGVGVSNGEIPMARTASTFAVLGAGNNGNVTAATQIIWRYAPPTSGDYMRGDICFNNNPTVGQPKGWTCTASGNPGTWVSHGNL